MSSLTRTGPKSAAVPPRRYWRPGVISPSPCCGERATRASLPRSAPWPGVPPAPCNSYCLGGAPDEMAVTTSASGLTAADSGGKMPPREGPPMERRGSPALLCLVPWLLLALFGLALLGAGVLASAPSAAAQVPPLVGRGAY